jgi:hypothetical protein
MYITDNGHISTENAKSNVVYCSDIVSVIV